MNFNLLHYFHSVILLLIFTQFALGAPRITCKAPVFDFGTRDPSESIDHTFLLENTGTSDLIISAIRPACGCTAANMTRQTIPPGESAELSTRLNLVGRTGDLHKSILIESNDPANPALQLTLVGKTAADFEIQPSVLVLRKDSPSKHATGSVQIRATDGSAFEISELLSANGKIKLRADPMPSGNAYQISASFDEEMPAGEHSDQVTISTNLKGGRLSKISTLVIVSSPVTVAPTKIALDQNPDKPVSRTLILKSNRNEIFEVIKIELPNSYITSKVQRLGHFGVRIFLANILATQELDGKAIKILINSGQVIEIPFQVKSKSTK
jgi:hypothetical protein